MRRYLVRKLTAPYPTSYILLLKKEKTRRSVVARPPGNFRNTFYIPNTFRARTACTARRRSRNGSVCRGHHLGSISLKMVCARHVHGSSHHIDHFSLNRMARHPKPYISGHLKRHTHHCVQVCFDGPLGTASAMGLGIRPTLPRFLLR